MALPSVYSFIRLQPCGEKNSPFLCNPVWRDRQQMNTAKNISFLCVWWGAEREGLGECGSHSQMLRIFRCALLGIQEEHNNGSSGHTEPIPWRFQPRILKRPPPLPSWPIHLASGAKPGLRTGHVGAPPISPQLSFSSFLQLCCSWPAPMTFSSWTQDSLTAGRARRGRSGSSPPSHCQ